MRTARWAVGMGRCVAASWLLLALPACSLFIDLDGLSAGGDGGAGGAGGAGGVGPGSGGSGAGGNATGAFSFTDDALEGEFGSGAFENTQWAADHVEMISGTQTAHFSSRVFDAGGPATWEAMSWVPHAPYGKPLPDQGAKETGYAGADRNADMTGNVLLLHLDGAEPLAPGQLVPDASGHGNDATVVLPPGAPRPLADGRFGQAFDDDAQSYLRVTVDPASELQFGVEALTWSLWVRGNQDCPGNDVYLGVEDPGQEITHLWLGCAEASEWQGTCPNANAGGTRAAGTFKSSQGTPDDGGTFCSSTSIDDGQWHHLALTKQGHPDAMLKLYVDGELEFTRNVDFLKPLQLLTSPELAIGAFTNGTYQAAGAFDEVAIWRRALSDEEIRALHRRGALRLGFQVRACADAACATPSAHVGPGGDPGAWFTDPATALGPGSALPLPDLGASRWLQYRARFESDVQEGSNVQEKSPWLRAVTVSGSR